MLPEIFKTVIKCMSIPAMMETIIDRSIKVNPACVTGALRILVVYSLKKKRDEKGKPNHQPFMFRTCSLDRPYCKIEITTSE
jgi:hypothetical protein